MTANEMNATESQTDNPQRKPWSAPQLEIVSIAELTEGGLGGVSDGISTLTS